MKSSYLYCEDIVFVSDSFLAVIDGATSNSKTLVNGKTEGQVASGLISDALYSMAHAADVYGAMSHINRVFKCFYNENNLNDHLKHRPDCRPTASMAVFSLARAEVWIIGDCQCLVDTQYYNNPKEVDSILANTRALYNEIALLKGSSIAELMEDDVGEEYIADAINNQKVFQNSTLKSQYNYTAVDGRQSTRDDIKVIYVDKSSKSLVLATDGYPKLFSTLQESEHYLERMLQSDPLCIGAYKSTKGLKPGNVSYDDRAYLRVNLTN